MITKSTDNIRDISPIALFAIAWGFAEGVGISLVEYINPALLLIGEWRGTQGSFLQALIALIGAMLSGLVLRRLNHAVSFTRVLALALVWAVSGLLPWYGHVPLGGLLTVLLLRRISPALTWRPGLTIFLGWIIGWGVPYGVVSLINPPATTLISKVAVTVIHGMIFGMVSGGVMLHQLDAVDWKIVDPDQESKTRSVRRIIDELNTNPVMAQLMKASVERQTYAITGAAVGVGLLSLLTSMWLWTTLNIQFTSQTAFIPFFLYMITLAPTARVPIIVAVMTALITTSDTQRQQFQLLRLTPITEREVTWSYTVAPLRHLRGLLTFEYIVMLLMLIGATCAFLPSFVSVSPIVVLGMFYGLFTATVGIIGVSVLAAAVGMRIALWWRDPGEAAILSALITLILVLSAVLMVGINLRQMSREPTLQLVASSFFFMIIPYVAAVEIVDTARPWGQQPKNVQ